MSIILTVLAFLGVVIGLAMIMEGEKPGIIVALIGASFAGWLLLADTFGEHTILHSKTYNVQTISIGNGVRKDVISVDGKTENLNKILEGVYTGKIVKRTATSHWAGGIYWVEHKKKYIQYKVVGDQTKAEPVYGY